MSMIAGKQQRADTQAGMVSIMVTMIMMIVLSLIVIGFAQIARRNSRQSLDRQLSTSAFYAAEAGVNDVRDLINTYGTPPAKPDCTNGSGATAAYYSHLPSATLNAGANVKYTCVMVNPATSTLQYTVGYTGTVVPLIAQSGQLIDDLTITWQKSTASATPKVGCNGNLVAVGSWTCGYAGLRFDLIPTNVAYDINTIRGKTMSSFADPVQAGGTLTAPFRTDGSQDLIKTRCSNTNCTLTLNNGLGAQQYYMRIMSQYYQNVPVQISGTDSGGNPVQFVGAQSIIDVTGKAQDVLRRIQVRIPADGAGTNGTSDYALETTDSICKRFDIMTNHYQSDAGNAVPGMDNGGNPLCKSP
ncbi:MAG TPA: PilX N-terminal domain-containing pilus assembly protein [Candidatus Saccharimonadales bacterium]|nr:PilX N-terminal domain-containing pilus assembly protein [Candidatus Saccharimonadales bacterium]